jgi:hypothetical protein
MRSVIQIGRWRLLGLVLLCGSMAGSYCREERPTLLSAEYFTVSNVCGDETGTVSAESTTTSSSAADVLEASEACTTTEGRNRIDVELDGVQIFVEGLPVRDLESTRISCVHQIDTPFTSSCTTTAVSTLELWETGGDGTGTGYVGFEADLLSLGAAPAAAGEPDEAVASVTVQCQGAERSVPLGGATVFEPITGFFVNCDTELSLLSGVETPGSHVRILSLQHRAVDPRCEFDGQCAVLFPGSATICGPNRICQAGLEGDPCTDTFDCDSSAPYCVEGACYDGSSGDLCYVDEDCTGGTCDAGVCS